ncbi:AI-2E family transporter [Enterococcus sp. DIV0876]|uniref:AI-2E family transporter n=1 Tax=Enterococcus sp. DIV0876 TaxID=2774633 RepID=UPI003D2F9EB7
MKFLQKSKIFASLVIICLIGLAIWIFSNILFVFRPLEAIFSSVFLPVLISVFIFYIFLPFFNWINKLTNRKAVALYSTLLLIVFAAYLIIQVIAPALAAEMGRFIGQVPVIINLVIDNIDHSYMRDLFEPLVESVNFSQVGNFAMQFLTGATNSLTSLISIVSHSAIILFTIPLLLVYMFKDGEKIPGFLSEKSPQKYRSLILQLCDDFHQAASAYIGGKLLVCSYVAISSYLVFSLLGLQNALLLGLICGVLDIIPYFGPFIGAAPAFLFALSQDIQTSLLLILGITVIQFGESYLVSPLVMNKVLHIHPIIAVFLLLIAGNLLGFVGMIVALPVYSIIVAMSRTIIHYWQQRRISDVAPEEE